MNHKLWNVISTQIYVYTGDAVMSLHIYKWKVHNGKIEIISFVVKFRSKPPLAVNVEVQVKVCSRPICICDVLYIKLNWIDANNEITKSRITLACTQKRTSTFLGLK